jgi:DNA-binding transcriptional regulator YdaS (Cro superfamily)
METPIKPSKLAGALGISVPYASQLLGGQRTPNAELALRIWRAEGPKLGPIEALSDDECDQLERLLSAGRKPIAASGEGFAA